MSARRGPSAAVTSFVVGSRYMPVYLAIIVLLVVASIWAPATLAPAGLEAIAPLGTFLAITALGQMLVIMTGGIDLSIPGTFLLGGLLVVGVGQQSDSRIWVALLTAIGVAALVGLGIYLVAYFSSEPRSLPRSAVGYFLVLVSALTLAWRALYIRIFTTDAFLRRALVVGGGRAGSTLLAKLNELERAPFVVAGVPGADGHG